MAETALESVLRRDRLVVAASLATLALLSWLYLLHLAAEMKSMATGGSMDMPDMDMAGMDMTGMDMSESSGDSESPLTMFVFLFPMWAVMMVGMMVPSAASTILLFAALERKRQASGTYGRTAFFVSGYLLAWIMFSIVAAALQITLSRAELISTGMAMTNSLIGGGLFIVAGIYQLSPFKDRCLTHCRSPLQWIAHHHRPGNGGALQMGALHGLYCVGCCWVLMLLLFVGGVMNLLWVAAIAALVLAEKLLPFGVLTARVAGAILIVAGLAIGARLI